MLLDMIANSIIFVCLVTHTRIMCVGKESWACMKVFSRQNATIFAGGKKGQGPSVVIFVLQECVRSLKCARAKFGFPKAHINS